MFIKSSTCFAQRSDHHQEVICINTASGIVTLETIFFLILDHSLVSRVTIPDAVLIQMTS